MVGLIAKFSKLRFSDGLKNAIFRLDFINTVFHKRTMMLIVYTEYKLLRRVFRKCFRHSFLSSVYYRPPWLGLEKIFKMRVLSRLGDAILLLVFAKRVNASTVVLYALSTVVQAFNSSKIT